MSHSIFSQSEPELSVVLRVSLVMRANDHPSNCNFGKNNFQGFLFVICSNSLQIMFSFRVIDSSEKVDTERLNRMQLETIGLILKFFPAVEFSQYIHEFLWHSGQCIGG